ncbi:hypothetical protein TcasGA2_TC005045 [Tribolium castaneum]|uniref:Retrovirus-related Pol polyprotein from transposon 17.6-like Protein n=1 Tax=Tribolium castaneum TaxID=7070 RepID=D7ELA7_TRICA|nr:hypothetical protein TcasGA2_TC005045 [Tribolium castaneum]
MEKLSDVPGLSEKIKKSSVAAIRAFHKLLYDGVDSGRRNRQHVRDFAGFVFADDAALDQKVEWATTNLTLGDLTSVCAILNIDYEGSAREVADRICTKLRDLNSLTSIEDTGEEEEEEAGGEDTNDDTPRRTPSLENERWAIQQTPKFVMYFKDIEDSIRPFSGEGSYQVENWVQDFEEMAEVMQFSELQKLVYAKKCLIGLSKQCIQCERGLNSWSKLKEILQDEFGKKISSADIHRLLSEKKKQRNESVLEYYFNMKEIAARSQIEEDAIIQYIVDGILDEMCNKTFLYEARNFRQLKTKLETYEKIKSRPSSSSMDKQRINKNAVINASVTNKSKSATNVTANNIVRCYNCGDKGHISAKCSKPKREVGSCFGCGSKSHQKKDCPVKQDTTSHLVEQQIIPAFIVKVRSNNFVDRPDEPYTQLELKLHVKPNHAPFYSKARRLSYAEKEAVKQITNVLLSKKVIKPSSSQYSSPIVLVRKKDGNYRMAVDYRELNKLTTRDIYPIPHIEEQIDNLKGKAYFTRLDLKDAFHNIKLDPESTKYTSFVTFMDQYEYTKMPFGLANGSSFFMRFINTAFRDLLRQQKVQIYLDDILIPTKTMYENIAILKEVLKVLVKNKLELRFDKCEFLLDKVKYLWYNIDKNGISPSDDNVKAIKEFPTPKNFRELHSFIGLLSYFRKFIRDFATVSKPLSELLKAKEFIWTDRENDCFESLKQKLISSPVLAIYSHKLETELHCDASSHGFGAVLMQKQLEDGKFHPVFFFSKRTTPTEASYHSFELEALAIIYSLERFRIYLQGIKFKIVTDCNSLKQTLERKESDFILKSKEKFKPYCGS